MLFINSNTPEHKTLNYSKQNGDLTFYIDVLYAPASRSLRNSPGQCSAFAKREYRALPRIFGSAVSGSTGIHSAANEDIMSTFGKLLPFGRTKGKNVSTQPDARNLRRVFPTDREKVKELVNYELPFPFHVQLHYEYLFLKAVRKVCEKLFLSGNDITTDVVLHNKQVRKALLNLWTDTMAKDAKRILLPLRNAETSPLRPLVVELINNVDMLLPDGAPKPPTVAIEFIGVDGVPVNAEKFRDTTTVTEEPTAHSAPQLQTEA